MTDNPIIWKPAASRAEASAMNRFMRRNGFDNYGDLYRWSIDDIAGVWAAVCRK